MRYPEKSITVKVKPHSPSQPGPRQVMEAVRKCSNADYKPLPSQCDDEDEDTIQIETPLGPLQLPEWVNSYSQYKHGEPYQGELTHLIYPRFTVHWRFRWNDLGDDREGPFSFEIAAPFPLDSDSNHALDKLDEALRWSENVETELHAWIAIPTRELTDKEMSRLMSGDVTQ